MENVEGLKLKGQRTIVNRQRTTGNGTINVESLTIKGEWSTDNSQRTTVNRQRND